MSATIEVSGELSESQIMKRLFQIVDGGRGTPFPLFDVIDESPPHRKWQVDEEGNWTAELKDKTLTIDYAHSQTDGRLRALLPWLVFAIGSKNQKDLLQEKMGFSRKFTNPPHRDR